MAKKAYVYSGTDWVPLASEVTDLTPYQTKANAQAPFRNLIINGAMQVAQRGTSTASVTGDAYITDRFFLSANSLGTWTVSQENDAPTGSGFAKSAKVLCTTADASPAAGDAVNFQHRIEGQNLQSIKKGTANAEQLTLSFWVKSNVTGTYAFALRDIDNSRAVSATYTINSSATWEKKTITFPADTTGAFDNDNALSLILINYLGAGTDFTSGTLATTWESYTAANIAVGQTNLASATNNYWQITGVQLEVGAVATPFEFKPFAQDLKECQRYYEKTHNYDTAPGSTSNGYFYITPGAIASGAITANFTHQFIVPKRSAPTIQVYSQNSGNAGYVYNKKNGATSAVDKNTGLSVSGTSGNSSFYIVLGNGVGATEYFNDDSSWVRYHWTADAEL